MCELLSNLFILPFIPWIAIFASAIFLVVFTHYAIFGDYNIFSITTGLQSLHSRTAKRPPGNFPRRWFALNTIALSLIPILFAVCGAEINVSGITKDLNFAAISIALATYVATIRIFLLSRLSDSTKPRLIKVIIASMIPADFNLILSAIFVLMKYFSIPLPLIDKLVNFSAISFLYAVIYLAFQHLIAWIISFYKLTEP